MNTSTPQFTGSEKKPRSSRSLWLWVALIFAFSALLWAAMFTASRHIDTREVPLATKGARP